MSIDAGPASAQSAAVIWSDDFLGYRWAPTHPMNPIRLALTMSLSASLGVSDGVPTVPPMAVDDRLLQTVHTASYLDAVRSASAVDDYVGGSSHVLERLFGLGSVDNPVFEGMHGAAWRVGGRNDGGGCRHRLRIGPPGREHRWWNAPCNAGSRRRLLHLQRLRGRYSLAARAGYDRIAYIDIDGHHGDGVQKVFAAWTRAC